MIEKNEIMNIMDYEVVDTRSNDIQISGTEVAYSACCCSS